MTLKLLISCILLCTISNTSAQENPQFIEDFRTSAIHHNDTLKFTRPFKKQEYICTPCDLKCDELFFAEAGTCPHCNMELVKKSDFTNQKVLVLNEINIEEGSGEFLIEGGDGKKEKAIPIYYHMPKNYKPDSKILIVIPGAGRNGDSYRDAWIKASEKYGVLILSPMYKEAEYDYGAYHMGDLIYNLNLENSAQYDENSNKVFLDEEIFSFKINSNRNEWIYNDFDRIFDNVVKVLGSTQTEYDIFGHSAGGQILHRFAIFQPNSKANRILASNSGAYALPDFNTDLPFGIHNTDLTKENIKASFKKNLVLFIGELDNENEQGGLILRSPTVDKQGTHRLERGTYFYNKSKDISKELGLDFNWKLRIVPNIGHDHRKMGAAAEKYLYDGTE
ncbi:hypothetical protein [Psychroserpens burtonensis]|nr:hypothetical protein [Psychroserpens burtonensis]